MAKSKGKQNTSPLEQPYANALKNVQVPSASESLGLGYAQDVMNFSKTPGKNIADAGFMQPHLQTFATARDRAQRARQAKGVGAVALGQPGSEAQMAQMRELAANQAGVEYAGMAENAYNNAQQQALGMLPALTQSANNRNATALNATYGAWQDDLDYRRRQPSTWDKIAKGVGTAVKIGAMFSDARLKFSVKTNPYGLQEVLKLKPVWYIMDGSEQVGFIAQEVEEVMPELVVEIRDGLKGLMYANMTSVLAKAVQELHAELESVKQQKKGGARKMLSSCLSWIRSIF